MLIEHKTTTSSRFDVRKITLTGMLAAISIVLGLTPLGFIPIPPLKATIMHVPVIIGAIIGGPLVGTMVGLIFGIFSIIQAIMDPLPTSFVFFNPLVSVLPRVLIGITSYYSYKLLKVKSHALRVGFGAFIGSFTNTIGVLGAIYLIYLESYAKALDFSIEATRIGILSVGVTSGLPEAIVSVLICIPVVQIVKKMRK